MGDLSEHFSRSEIACRCGCGIDVFDSQLLSELERIRHYFGQPVTILSGNRCKRYNRQVGGAKGSYHRRFKAVDFTVRNVRPAEVQQTIERWWLGKYGIGRYTSWTHLDVRSKPARWEKWR